MSIDHFFETDEDVPVQGIHLENKTGMDLTLSWRYEPRTGIISIAVKPMETNEED